MPSRQISRKVAFLIANILLQGWLFLLLVTLQLFWRYETRWSLLLRSDSLLITIGLLGVFCAILGVFMVREIIRMADVEEEARLQALQLEEAKEFNTTLSAFRHDFLNHLQVIGGLIQLGKPQDAYEYLAEITAQLIGANKNRLVSQPEVEALLWKKKALAEEKGIRLQFNIRSNLGQAEISGLDLARILGNLLDNAIYAVKDLLPRDRIVTVSIEELEEGFRLAVHNWGPPIPVKLQRLIFERGFTTKGAEGNGLGLDIVATLVQKNRGKINLVSTEAEGTTFTVWLPRRDGNLAVTILAGPGLWL